MPYMMMKGDNGKMCVHKKNADGSAGERVACHDTEAEAEAHMKALYANVPEAKESMTETTPIKTAIFIEALEIVPTEAKLDGEGRTVEQVLIRAGLSKNRRFYSEAVLMSAIHLFEGVQTYSNHPTRADLKDRPERSVRELTGWIDGVTYQGNALRGVRHFLRTQAGNDSWAVVEDIIAGKAPNTLMGASINAVGKGREGKGEKDEDIIVVESIEAINSVDDVTAPAAGGGWEKLVAGDGDELMRALFKALDYQEYLEARPDYVERLKREHKFVRLGDATKTALAEADQKVKTAKTELARSEEALLEARDQLDNLTEVNATLLSELERARRELAVTEALKRVKIAEVYKDDLRERLPSLPQEEWEGVIGKEIAKARSAGAIPRVPVTGAGQQIHHPLESGTNPSPVPLPDEDVDKWQRRMEALKAKKG